MPRMLSESSVDQIRFGVVAPLRVNKESNKLSRITRQVACVAVPVRARVLTSVSSTNHRRLSMPMYPSGSSKLRAKIPQMEEKIRENVFNPRSFAFIGNPPNIDHYPL